MSERMRDKIDDATAKINQDHWTFPEDPETKAGWGIFNFDWLMKPYREAVEWHDRVTTKNSEAQKMGITNERINTAWRAMLKEMHRTTPRAGFVRRLGWFAGFFVSKVNRYFYEGPLR